LELEVAGAFRKAGFDVTQSAVYADPETEKGREIDVIAYSRDAIGLIQVFFVIECKASSNPWVVLINREQHSGPTYYSLGLAAEATREALPHGALYGNSHLSQLLQMTHSGGYGIRQAFCKDNDPAYGAAISVLKAAKMRASEKTSKPDRLVFAMPVLVVDSPIFECHVADNGALEFKEVPISEFFFTAYVPEQTKSVIRIVSRRALPSYASHCVAVSERIKGLLQYKVEEWKRSFAGGPSVDP
jgi:hypothetical protein